MANYVVSDTTLTSLADTIRAKGNTSALLEWPQGYNAAINAINPLTLSVNTSGPSSIVSVNDATDLDAKQVVVGIEPVQDLHGYDNPWPAGGGKNLFNKAAVTDNAWIDDQGVEHSVSGYWLSDYIPVTAGKTYFRPQTGSGRNAYYASDKSFVGYVMSQNTALVTPSNAAYFRFVGTGTTYNDNIQFEKGSTATSYVPYSNVCPITGWTGAQVSHSGADTSSPDVISIAFPAAAGTVYGGTLDVTNGVLTVDRAMVTFNGGSSEQWWLAQDYTNRFGNHNTGTFCDGIVEHQISNWLKSSSWGNTSFTFGLRSNGSLYICLDASADQITEAQFRAYLASTPLQIVYTLATPVTYDLTPQDIELLSGYNVIFADCGDVALSYYTEDFADLADEIDFAEGGDY